MVEENKTSIADAKAELWRRGNLSWLLDKNQKDLYHLFYNSDFRTQTWLLSRRSGKSFCLCVLALEQCIKNPKSIVKYTAPTKLQVNTYLRPLMEEVLATCPQDIKPVFRAKDYIYFFANGSEIQLAGTDAGHAEKLRGGSSHLAIIDEAGEINELDYLVKSILLPTTLTTKAKIIISGTPPKTSEHDYLRYIEKAEENGSLIKRTIYQNPRLTKEDIDLILEEFGGAESEAFRREFMCEILKDSTTSVIPEFTEGLAKQIVKEWERPPFFDTYVAMDIGFTDLTVVLFGYFDFRNDKVVIEDELVIDFTNPDNNLPKLIEGIKEKERQLWFNPLTNEVKKTFMRVSDINPIVTQEIARASNGQVAFAPTKKDDNEAAINLLRVMLAAKKIIIHPRCKTLVRHLYNVKWPSANSKREFARSVDNGHYDGVDACKYLVRSIAYGRNPYPAHYDLNTKDLFVADKNKFMQRTMPQLDVYKKIFNMKRDN